MYVFGSKSPLKTLLVSMPLIGVALLFSFFTGTNEANAQYLTVIQSDNSDVATSSYGNWNTEPFTGISGLINSITVSVFPSGIGGGQPTQYQLTQMKMCEDKEMTVNCVTDDFTNVVKDLTIPNNCTFVTFDLPNDAALEAQADKWVELRVVRGPGTDEILRSCGTFSNPLPQSPSPFFNEAEPFDMYLAIDSDQPSLGGNTIPSEVVTQYIAINEPTYATTTASTTVHINIDFETPLSINFRPTTTRSYKIYDAVTEELEYSYGFTLPPNTGENTTVDHNILLTNGSKIITAGYYTEDGELWSEEAQSFFNVLTNTYLDATGLETPNSSPGGLTQIDCGTFDVGCQFQKALVFLFIPPDGTLDRFTQLWKNVETKRPFGYITVTIEQLKSLNQSGSSAFTLGTIPFMDSLFTPFQLALSGILWAIFFIYWYHHRLKKLDI